MAYNPFDEVIENDPAYRMVNGGDGPDHVLSRSMMTTRIGAGY